jgi:hypothetical protein
VVNTKNFNILIFFILYSFSTVDGQDLFKKYISIPKQEMSIEDYLQFIEKETGYKLIYSSAIIENRSLKISKDSLNIKELLDTIFYKLPISPIIKNDLLILSPQSEKIHKIKKIKLIGTVKDIQTRNPIPFASVFVPNESIGTITNNEGKFEIFLPGSRKIDTLMVSYLGYFTEKISTDKFLSGPVDIFINPNNLIVLSQIIVKPENPVSLVLNAINNKASNYSNKPELLTCFFREATKQNSKYISLSEAVVNIYKTPYSSFVEDNIKLIKGRKGSNAGISRLINLVVIGSLYNNIRLDIVKYGINFLDPEQMSSYEYTFDRQTNYNGRHTYIIKFKFYENQPNIGYDGFLYIDAATFAIVRVNFEISPYSMYYAKEALIRNVPTGYQVKPTFGTYEIEYRFYDGCWNLMHIQSNIGFSAKKKRTSSKNGFLCDFISNSELVVTDKVSEGFNRIRYNESAKPNDVLEKQISEYDMEFWGNETIIVPEEPLLETIEKLKLMEKSEKIKLVSTKPN